MRNMTSPTLAGGEVARRAARARSAAGAVRLRLQHLPAERHPSRADGRDRRHRLSRRDPGASLPAMPARASSPFRGGRNRWRSRGGWARPRRSRCTIIGEIIERVRELTGGTFCDRVIEAVGKQWPLDLAAELTREGGRLVIAGYHQDGPRQVNMQLWNWRGFDVANAHERDPAVAVRGMREAVEAIESGRHRPDAADHAPLSARAARRGARRDARPARQFRQSAS